MDIIVFGDSITQGIGAKYSWCDILKSHIQENMDNNWSIVFNMGISGDTTKGVLDRFESEIKSRGHDIIIFAIGTNDSKIINSKNQSLIESDEFEKNTNNLYLLAKKYTDNIAFLGLPPVVEEDTDKILKSLGEYIYFSNKRLEEYSSIIKNICDKHDLLFIDLKNINITNEELHDGLHPNYNGQQKIYKEVYSNLKNKGWIL